MPKSEIKRDGQKRKLSERREKFCQEYIVDLNATQAAIRAGYSEKTAGAQGFYLLKDVAIQERLDVIRAERSEATQVSAFWVIEKLRRIVEADPRRLFNEDGTPKRVVDIPDDVACAVAGLEVGDSVKVRLNDRLKAIELLGRHLGMFLDRIQADVRQQAVVQIYIPDNGRDSVVEGVSEHAAE